jgi:hypothetical protein
VRQTLYIILLEATATLSYTGKRGSSFI